MTKRAINIFIIVILSFIIFGTRRCNIWYDRLTSQHRQLTVAHVYSSYKVKGSTYYEYIYKINNTYYTASTGGSNVEDFKQFPIQCFLLAYDKKSPTTHILIWSHKFDDFKPLNAIEENIPNIDKEIKRFTMGWNGLSPSSDVNDLDEIAVYKSKLKN